MYARLRGIQKAFIPQAVNDLLRALLLKEHADKLVQTYRYILAVTQEKRSSGFQTRSDTNRPVQSQKQARSLKFQI